MLADLVAADLRSSGTAQSAESVIPALCSNSSKPMLSIAPHYWKLTCKIWLHASCASIAVALPSSNAEHAGSGSMMAIELKNYIENSSALPSPSLTC
jgi:hypothetical protein